MSNDITDITVTILGEIRDEVRGLRGDTNLRFERLETELRTFREETNARFERVEADIRAIVGHFERDYMTLASKVGTLEGQLHSHLRRHH